MARFLRLLMPLAALLPAMLSGCATAAQNQFHDSVVETTKAVTALNACVRSVVEKPAYAALLSHTPDLTTGQLTMSQLTDETLATPADARLFSFRHDAVESCQKAYLKELSLARPDLVPLIIREYDKTDQVSVRLVERKITWAEWAASIEAIEAHMTSVIQAENQKWLAELNAENRDELAQRQAAANALMQWSQQQQMIDAATRPVTTTCQRTGSFVNCTSY